jgi:O-antigen/teichoic acid export membrane protein
VFLPVVSRHLRHEPERLAHTTGVAVRFIVALSLPVVITGTLLAGPVLSLLFGPEFIIAAPVLRLLVWFFPLSLSTTLTGYLLLAADRERRFCRNTAVGVAAGLALSIPGIMLLGPTGAALGALAGELVLFLLMGYDFLHVTRPAVGVRLLGVVAACLPLAAAVLLLKDWNWLAAAAVGLLAYAGVCALTRSLTFEDLGLRAG